MIIYKATNLVNNKIYIGQTTGYLSRRKYQHEYYALKKEDNIYFHNALRKYGIKNFHWEVIEKCKTNIELNEMEFHYIHQYNSKTPNGYNLTDGYDKTTFGYKLTKEQLQIRSKLNSGKNNPNYGNGDKIAGDKNPAKRSEVREKIRQKALGRKRPDVASYRSRCYYIYHLDTGEEEVIKNLSKWCRDNGYNYSGAKSVLSGKWSQYKNLLFDRL